MKGDKEGHNTRRGYRRNAGSVLDYFTATASLHDHAVHLQVLHEGKCTMPVQTSDHNPPVLTMTGGSLLNQCRPRHSPPFGFSNLQYNAARSERLQANLRAAQQADNTQGDPQDATASQHYSTMLTTIAVAAKETYPPRRSRPNLSLPLWADAEYRRAKRVLARATKCGNPLPQAELRRLHKEFRIMRNIKKRNWRHRIGKQNEAACVTGQRAFWRRFNTRKTTTCPVQMAAQVAYVKELHGTQPQTAPVVLLVQDYHHSTPEADMLNVGIRPAEVEEALHKLKTGMAAGKDGLSLNCSRTQAPFSWPTPTSNCSSKMLAGDIPQELALGTITAVHKSGSTFDMNNYRSITVTPVFKKLFDFLCRLTGWAEQNGLHAHRQDSGVTSASLTSCMSCMPCSRGADEAAARSSVALWTSARHLTWCRGMYSGRSLAT